MERKRILSGMRPTGKLHLGHYCGALQNWVRLQKEYQCFYMIADWHALTTDYEKIGPIQEYTLDMVLDMLAAGIDPEKSTLFVQSKVKEHAELALLLGMLTPLPWLERVPTYKEQMQQLTDRDLSTFGFLGYPVLQAADIMIYKAHAVPVGVDQQPHIELTREIARRFNFFYGEIFPEPECLLAEESKILGLDNRKMSKSYENALYLSDTPDVIRKKVSTMITDPARVKRSDPGHPETCNVFTFHKIFSPPEVTEEIRGKCERAEIGCVEDKKKMAEELITAIAPHQSRRAELAKQPAQIRDILNEGNRKATAFAKTTMDEVRKAMHLK
ncbi:MAG: tryptophan--tRNA ligase [bacterium]|nr:tryptophan--tRNA ligase [bacterium]